MNDLELIFFEHRMDPEAIISLYISGRVKTYNVKYKSPRVSWNTKDTSRIKFTVSLNYPGSFST